MPIMAEKRAKRGPGRPSGRTPFFVLHSNIDPRIGDAITAFIEAQRFKPNLRDVVELAFTTFLENEGFWPPEETDSK